MRLQNKTVFLINLRRDVNSKISELSITLLVYEIFKAANRFSLAFFWCFEDEKMIMAPDEVVGEGNVRLYKPFVCLDVQDSISNSI